MDTYGGFKRSKGCISCEPGHFFDCSQGNRAENGAGRRNPGHEDHSLLSGKRNFPCDSGFCGSEKSGACERSGEGIRRKNRCGNRRQRRHGGHRRLDGKQFCMLFGAGHGHGADRG